MKKTISLIALLTVIGILAAPKTSSLVSSCLWENSTGTLHPADGTPVFIFPDGGAYLGGHTRSWWGEPSGYELLWSFRDTTLGDYDGQNIYIATTDGTNLGDFEAYSGSWGAGVNVRYFDGSQFIGIKNEADSSGVKQRFNLGTTSVTITVGTGAPIASEPDGSLYLRAGVGMYVRESGAWVAK